MGHSGFRRRKEAMTVQAETHHDSLKRASSEAHDLELMGRGVNEDTPRPW